MRTYSRIALFQTAALVGACGGPDESDDAFRMKISYSIVFRSLLVWLVSAVLIAPSALAQHRPGARASPTAGAETASFERALCRMTVGCAEGEAVATRRLVATRAFRDATSIGARTTELIDTIQDRLDRLAGGPTPRAAAVSLAAYKVAAEVDSFNMILMHTADHLCGSAACLGEAEQVIAESDLLHNELRAGGYLGDARRVPSDERRAAVQRFVDGRDAEAAASVQQVAWMAVAEAVYSDTLGLQPVQVIPLTDLTDAAAALAGPSSVVNDATPDCASSPSPTSVGLFGGCGMPGTGAVAALPEQAPSWQIPGACYGVDPSKLFGGWLGEPGGQTDFASDTVIGAAGSAGGQLDEDGPGAGGGQGEEGDGEPSTGGHDPAGGGSRGGQTGSAGGGTGGQGRPYSPPPNRSWAASTFSDLRGLNSLDVGGVTINPFSSAIASGLSGGDYDLDIPSRDDQSQPGGAWATGGVIIAVSMRRMMITPNHTGSKPRDTITGVIMGTVATIIESVSMNMPRTT